MVSSPLGAPYTWRVDSTWPKWCTRADGPGHVLVVAPHGGISASDLLTADAAGRRGNDLHTASLARQLAAKLDGSLLVNDSVDRNELDLNRVRDVVDRAPWFLAEIERQVERILSSHERALVLFVHGWHVEQARCDLGVGAALESALDAEGRDGVLTARAEFVKGRLERFRRALEDCGVIATYGERWPAAHKNNVMRLFRRKPDGRGLSPRLATWAREGRVDAVQLELGSPLRWPGVLRDRLIACVEGTFGGRGAAVVGTAPTREAPGPHEAIYDRPTARMLQAFDPASGEDGLGLIVGAMHLPGKDVGARLQLFPGGQRMGIFVGHGRCGPALGVPDLHFHETADGFDVRFDGRVLEVADAAAYFENEATRVDARLREVKIGLSFQETSGGVGAVHGEVELDGRPFSLSTTAFADGRPPAGRGIHPGMHGMHVVASFGGSSALRIHGPSSEDTWRVSRWGPGGWSERECRGRLAGGEGGAWILDLDGDGSVSMRVRTRAAVLRPVAAGRYVHTTHGVVRVAHGDDHGVGFFEYRRPV